MSSWDYFVYYVKAGVYYFLLMFYFIFYYPLQSLKFVRTHADIMGKFLLDYWNKQKEKK